MVDNYMGVTETSATSIDIVSTLTQMELRNKAVLFNAINDYSNLVIKGADSVKVPRGTSLTAEDKSEGTAATLQAITWSTDDIPLTTNAVTVVRLENIASMQSMVDQEAEILKYCVSSIVQKYEDVIFAELVKASSTAPDHKINSDGYSLAAVDILEAKRLLDVQNAPQEERFMLIHPTQLKEVLQIDNFILQDRYPQQTALMNGEVGMVYGFKVLMSATCTENKSYFWQKGHVGFAKQQDMLWKSIEAPLVYQAQDFSLASVCGAKVLRAGILGVEITIQ